MREAQAFLFGAQESPSVLGESRQGAGMVQALEKSVGVGFSLGQMVHRRKDQCLVQLPRSPRQRIRDLTDFHVYDVYDDDDYVTKPGGKKGQL
jgi:hypothetical protein